MGRFDLLAEGLISWVTCGKLCMFIGAMTFVIDCCVSIYNGHGAREGDGAIEL